MFDVRCHTCGIKLHDNIFQHPEVLSRQQAEVVTIGCEVKEESDYDPRASFRNSEILVGTGLEGISVYGMCLSCLSIIQACQEAYSHEYDYRENRQVMECLAEVPEILGTDRWIYANRAGRLAWAKEHYPDRDYTLCHDILMDGIHLT